VALAGHRSGSLFISIPEGTRPQGVACEHGRAEMHPLQGTVEVALEFTDTVSFELTFNRSP